MDRFKHLAWPAYLIGAILILFPLVDSFISVLPVRPGTVSWRFGAIGMFSRALMTPLLGLLLMFAAAAVREHLAFQKVLAVLTGLAALVILVCAGLFALDAVQMGTQVRPQAKAAFNIASIVAVLKMAVAFAIAVVFTIVVLRRRDESLARVKRDDASPLVMGAAGR